MNHKKKPLLDENKFKQELDREALEKIVGGLTLNPLNPKPRLPGISPGTGGPIPGDCDW